MTELNVLSRTQRVVVDPLTSAVAVVYAGQQGPAGPAVTTVGTPVISGLAYKGAPPGTTVVPGGGGTSILLDPTNGLLQKVGTDIQLVSAGASTFEFKVLANGLYHINGHIRIDGVAPTPGSLMGIRINNVCIRRETFVATAYSTVNISAEVYLSVSNTISLFGYSTGGNWMASYVDATAIDGYSPRLSVWRISGVA